MVEEVMDKEQMREIVTQHVEAAINSGEAMQMHRNMIMMVDHPGIRPGTFVLGFYGTNKGGEDRFQAILMDIDGLLDVLDSATRGVIYERRSQRT